MSSGPTFLSAGRPLRERHELPTPAFGCPRGEPAPPESSAAPAGRSPCGGGRAREKGPGRATQEHNGERPDAKGGARVRSGMSPCRRILEEQARLMKGERKAAKFAG
ncbi:unnamed protein product [Prorocentrum cordatum]|nr:unnamed protein product [Polarella glacialis]